MRIAQVAPLYESVPPKLYGGTERVVSYLTEELVRMGHEVTLFASGDSVTKARLIPGCAEALWQTRNCRETLPHHVRLMDLVFEDVSRFDVIHFHSDYIHLPLLERYPCRSVTTPHGLLHMPDLKPLLAAHPDVPLVSISNNQRAPIPEANWRATVYHGLPKSLHTYHEDSGEYLAFLGRMSPEKGVERAIEIAQKSQMELRIAAKIYPEERAYFKEKIEPLLRSAKRWVEFIGEVGGEEKDRFLGKARALLFPIEWPEPFGLVMVESLACGTPVIGWRNGSVPELITTGRTGFIVESIGEAVRAVERIGLLNRKVCRDEFEMRFTATRMAADYLQVYRQLEHLEPGTENLPAYLKVMQGKAGIANTSMRNWRDGIDGAARLARLARLVVALAAFAAFFYSWKTAKAPLSVLVAAVLVGFLMTLLLGVRSRRR